MNSLIGMYMTFYETPLPDILEPKLYYTPAIPREVSEGRPVWQWTK